jgi:hypothetical protein
MDGCPEAHPSVHWRISTLFCLLGRERYDPAKMVVIILLSRRRLQPTLTFQLVLQILKSKQKYRPQKR